MLTRIRDELSTLSPAERRVGEWVIAHPRQVVEATLATVAENCGSSEPTVIRFCRRFGLSGYRELTLRLSESLSRPVSYVHRDVDVDDSTVDAVTKVIDSSIQAIVDVRNNLRAMPIEAAVDAMANARQLVFAGLGASACVAQDAQHKFFRLGIPCSVLVDTPGVAQFAAIAKARVVFVYISHSGGWRQFSQAARAARRRGATVIAITRPDSALAEAVDIVLPCSPDEDTSTFTPMSSRLAQLALLDALQVALALRLSPGSAENLRLSKQALNEALDSH